MDLRDLRTLDRQAPADATAVAPVVVTEPVLTDAQPVSASDHLRIRQRPFPVLSEQLAKTLQAATLGQAGTDEAAVFEVLGSLHTQVDAANLEKAFFKLTGKHVAAVLTDELSLGQRTRALDLLKNQQIDWSATSGMTNHLEGALNAFDDLGTAIKQHPIATAATLGVGIVASMRSPSLMATVGLATLGYQTGSFIRQEAGALTENDAGKRARRQIAAGSALANVALTLPGTRTSAKLVTGAFSAARKAEGVGASLKAFTNYQSTWGNVLNFRRPYAADVGGKIDGGPSTGDAVKDLKNYWDAVEKSNDPNAIMAKEMAGAYKALTPKARAATIEKAMKELSPAARERVFKALEAIGADKNSPMKQLLQDPTFIAANSDQQLNRLTTLLAAGHEEEVTSLIVALGTGHVKIGQVMADSPVVPPAWGNALRKLQKDLPAMPDADVQKMLEAAGMADRYKVGKLLGVASVGQVHLATDTKSGATVVLKFLKPNVSKTEIKQEFKFMEACLKPYFDAVHPEKARFLRDNLHSFRDGVVEEINFATEAKNITKFGKIYPKEPRFQGIELVEVARNKTVLVMKPAIGVDFKDLATLPKDQQVKATQEYAHAMFQQIFGEKHYFHADPHPGNVKFNPETGKVVFMDMGATATITGAEQRDLYELTFHLMAQDAKGLATFYVNNAERLSSTMPREELISSFQADIQRFFDRPGYSPNYMIESAKEINELAQKHGVWPKSANVWLTKTMFTMANTWNRTITTEDSLFNVGGPYMVKGLVQAFRADPKAFGGTVARIAKTLGTHPGTVARSVLEIATINPAVLDGIPQGFMAAVRGIVIADSQTAAAGTVQTDSAKEKAASR